ncbi:hydroxyacid dehydrogenase [Alicyclobacillus acidiphilus]|uniref:hydroxyacid dehydrogenase n=1 Tax=Alicyclobacillus acidiphilus TaxID=182455 RepID=UPI000831A6FF|nr:hydroxyacid dehydrogenase [Alicyclobacillus acidiphilus]
MRIVIAEDLWEPLPQWMRARYEVIYDPELFADEQALIEQTQSASALVVRNRTKVDERLLAAATELKIVGRLGVGLDNIDLSVCRNRNIQVIAARGCNANSVAEYVIASMFYHSRFLHRCDDLARQGVWDRQLATGSEIAAKTLGLIGVGDIGQRVAIRAKALGMRVLAFDPLLHEASMLVQDFGVERTDMDRLLSEADFVSIHVPLTPDTRHLLGLRELRKMKPASVLINTARGGIVDEDALCEVLVEQTSRFAVLDVRETEPPVEDRLRSLPNTLLSPHIAGITHESSARVTDFVLRGVDDALQLRA